MRRQDGPKRQAQPFESPPAAGRDDGTVLDRIGHVPTRLPPSKWTASRRERLAGAEPMTQTHRRQPTRQT